MAKGWHNEYERHALAGMGIKTGTKSISSTAKSGYKIPTPNVSVPVPAGGREFKLGNGVVVVCWYEKTRMAFRHMAVVYKNGQEVYRTKIPYQNRTWESYEYQSVLEKAIDGVGENTLPPEAKAKAMTLARNNFVADEHERVEKEFGRIGAIAQMGELFGSTKKEKNDWKARMLKAGLGDKGLQMPEDWDTLSEDEKEKRLNAVIAFTKKKD